MINLFLKRSAGILIAIATLFSSPTIQAQETVYTPLPAPLDFLAVKDISIETTAVFEYGQLNFWSGEGLHAGVQTISLTLFNHKEIQKNASIPEHPALVCEIYDMEGNLVVRQEEGLESTFSKIKFSHSITSKLSAAMTVLRGGKYKLKAEISPGLFSYETEFVLNEEPCMQIISGTEGSIPETPYPEIYLSGGYPYESSEFSGEKSLNWKLTSINSPTEILAEGTEAFRLKSASPTLAPTAELMLKPEFDDDEDTYLKAGEYQYTLISDFAPANHSFKVRIYDKLHTRVFVKASYLVGVDKEATIKVDMSYGYPFIGKGADGKPTVEVCADLLGVETNVSYSDEAWADSEMNCIAELKIPIETVTDKDVEEYEGVIPLKLSVKFNGELQSEFTVELRFHSQSSGVTDIKAETSGNSKVRYYNVFGVEVDGSYRGIVITSDGRKILR